MDNNKYINDFLDGKLTSEAEANFFANLSSSDDARHELRQMLNIENSMKSDAARMAPSAKSTIAVFDRLGFNVPQSPAPAGGLSAIGHKISSFFATRPSHFFTALLSSAVTAILIYLAMPGTERADTIMAADNPDIYRQPLEINIPVSDSFENINDANKSKHHESKAKNNPILASEDDQSSPGETVSSTDDAVKDYDEKHYMDLNFPELKSKDVIYNPVHTPKQSLGSIVFIPVKVDAEKNVTVSEEVWEKIGIDFELRGASYFDFPKADISESSSPDLKNLNITGLYSINENLFVGLDVRQEFFYQKFEGVDDGKLYSYRQYPNLFSAGAVARYYLFNSGKINGFLQAGASLSRAGAVGRLMGGLRYMAGRDYGFVLGVEGSNLFYKHSDSYFNAPKIGIHYGIVFCL